MKEGAIIRFLVVALPAGLFLLGAAAMFMTHLDRGGEPVDPNEAVRLEAAALKRRPVSRGDLANSLEILANRIGERHQGKPESLESAALWIESTLGGGNIGYTVERQSFESGGVEVRNLVAELPGRGRRDEIIVVGAHYDTDPGSPGANDNGSGVAALVALARAFAGDPQGRTIRFAAFVNGAPSHLQTETMGSLVYGNRCLARGERIVVMLALDSLGDLHEGNAISIIGGEDSFYFVDSALVAFSGASPVPVQGKAASTGGPSPGPTDSGPIPLTGYPLVEIFVKAVPRSLGPGTAPDTLDKIDLGTLEGTTIGIEAVLRAWANP